MKRDFPQAGDVVVHRQVHSPAVYILSAFDEPPQLSCLRYEQAVAHATAFAAKTHIDVWYTSDEQIFKRIARHRLPTS